MPALPVRESTGERSALLPEGWLRALVAALEAVLLGWVVCVVPAIAAYVATAALPSLGEYTWHAALGVGSAGWLLGHGAPAGALSLVPLGLSAVLAALVMLVAGRHRLHGAALAICGIGYVALVQAVALLSAFEVDRLRLAIGSILVAGVGVAWALRRSGVRSGPVLSADAAAAPSGSVTHRLALVGWRSVRGALAATVVLGAVGLAAAVAALVLHADTVLGLHSTYSAGMVGGTVLVLGQLAYLPTAGVWGLAYVAGPGFAVGTGTTVTPTVVELGAVPSIPLLGALPVSTSPAGLWPAVLVVLAGVVAGWWSARPGQAHRLLDAVAGALGTALLTGVGVLLLGMAASGGIGPGRMTELGPDPFVLAGLVTALVGLGAMGTVTAIHPRTRTTVTEGVRSVWSGGVGTVSDGEPGGESGGESAGRSTRDVAGVDQADDEADDEDAPVGEDGGTHADVDDPAPSAASGPDDEHDTAPVPRPGRWSATGSMSSAATPRSADSPGSSA